MSEPLPIVLVPGLLCTSRLYAGQIEELWRAGPVTIADHTRDDSMAGAARRILADAPPRFALAGLSMGGYIAFEILRQAPERVARLALLDTTARPDTPEQTEARRGQIALTESGRFAEVPELLMPKLLHPTHQGDAGLRAAVVEMAEAIGPAAFVVQQRAIIGRIDSRPSAGAIRCPTLVLVGDGDAITPPDRAEEMAGLIGGARFVTIPVCGHLSSLERPREVARALADWLRQ
ncbi:MAG TPA: alpha/beta fold hydrolase [Kofleriaceae bacterium]|nr:alpha/beta fold hydrolase [Kofleriaceae bacterium]